MAASKQPRSVQPRRKSNTISLASNQDAQGNLQSRGGVPAELEHLDKSSPPKTLAELYKEWVQIYANRSKQYGMRLDAAWKNLQADIHRWQEAKSEHYVVSHHIKQFGKFAENASSVLLNDPEKQTASDSPEALDFRALVVGVFTAQWSLLRNVAQQRTAGSPYRTGILELDEIVKQNYARLYNIISSNNPKLPLLTFAPLVYLGNAGALTVFNRRVPLMLSVPLAALPPTADYGLTKEELEQIALAQMAIPHEVAHALFAQIPELITEISDKLDQALQNGEIKAEGGRELNAREIILYRSAFAWVEEICADLFGTALAGEVFARSARWVMLSSEETAGITDKTHPPAIIRPLVNLLALSTLEDNNKRFEETRQQFDKEIGKVSTREYGDIGLNRRFRSVPALIFVRLETVSTILADVVTRILAMKLATLGGITVSALLKEIYALEKALLPDKELPTWGDDPSIKSESFVLDFPAEMFPSYMTPGVSIRPGGWDIPIIRDILALLSGG